MRYQIRRAGTGKMEDRVSEKEHVEEEEEELNVGVGEVEGEIVHLFSGLGEYTSKRDNYGITLPSNSSE